MQQASFGHSILPWRCSNFVQLSRKLISNNNFSKSFSISASIRNQLKDENSNRQLPVSVKNSNRYFRYSLDGENLKLLPLDAEDSSATSQFDNQRRIATRAVRDFFLPSQVPENYFMYVKWKLVHRIPSSALQVLATQAMFHAIGIGQSRSFPSAAALKWLLKDGLGRLSRCIYTATVGTAFDTNLRMVRFSTSLLFSVSIGVELLTRVFPRYFLVLATLANIAKQISLACYLVTSSAVHRSFAVADNISEVSAKSQIQNVCFDIIGLSLAAAVNFHFRNNQRFLAVLPFLLYPFFAALDIFGIYRALTFVHLQTLNKDRLEIIFDTFIKSGHIPSPSQVAEEETFFPFVKNDVQWPIRIGSIKANSYIHKCSIKVLQSVNKHDAYFFCVENHQKGTSIKRGILICLREGCTTEEVKLSLLQACYVRRRLVESGDVDADVEEGDWMRLVEESKGNSVRDLGELEERMCGEGWSVKNVLLSSKEQERFCFVED